VANDESILREVDQELAEDRQWALFRKHGPAIIGAASAIVLGVAGWQIYNYQKDAKAKRQALEYKNALELLVEDSEAGRTALQAVAEEGGGYGVLAQLQRAAAFARAGERLNAQEAYRAVYNDGAVSKRLREFARLRAAYISLSFGRDEVLADLGDLADQPGPFSVYAREVSGLAALEAKDYETALSIFRQLSIDISAPSPVRQRAENFAALASAGKTGVNISGDLNVEDITSIVAGEVEDVANGEGEAAPTEDGASEGEAVSEETVPETATEAPSEAAPAEDEAPVEENAGEDTEPAESENE
jgi:hypothetical protein